MSQAELDRALMARAIEAAAGGRTAPNPHVGALISRGDEVMAIGFHEGPGRAHAEVAALRALEADASLRGAARGATLYCTLEPCNHHGRTPPCTEAILAAGIARVVVGCRDPKHYPTGPGIERLRAGGVEVEAFVLERECERLIEDFHCLVERGRPLVIGKAAVTLDGRIATRTGDSKWITGEPARTEAHRLRDRADAVMVGVETVLADDPRLDVRLVSGRDPLRVVLDTHLRTPPSAQVIAGPSTAAILLVHGPAVPEARRSAFAGTRAQLVEMPLDDAGRISLPHLLTELGRRDVMQLLVEGGGRVLGALLDADLVDRLAIFVAPVVLGDPEGRPLAHRAAPVHTLSHATRLDDVRSRVFGDDVLIEGRIRRG